MVYWLHGLDQMKSIEDHYGIKFKLSDVEDVESLYYDVAVVYNGFNNEINTRYTIPYRKDSFDFEIAEPKQIDDKFLYDMDVIDIFGVRFRPCKLFYLPGKYRVKDYKKRNELIFPVCCEYEIEN